MIELTFIGFCLACHPSKLLDQLPLYRQPAPLQKPASVSYAEYALWAWTAWTCVYGIFQTWHQIPMIEDLMSGQLQGMISISADTLMKYIIGLYSGLAIMSGWIVYKVGQGKHWARSTTMWSFALQIVTMVIPPYHEAMEYLFDIPDVGLQIFALYLLYTEPGRDWFEISKSNA